MMEEIQEIARRLPGKRILLQVPEGLKPRIPEIVEALEKEGKEVVVDVEPIYGACDVRLREMEAAGADVILHVGHLPMIEHPRVYYVPWKRELDFLRVRKTLEVFTKRGTVCLATTGNFRWVLKELRKVKDVVLGKGSWRIPYEGVVLGCDTSACEVEADLNVFLGDGYFHPLAIWVNTKRPTYVVYPNGRSERVSFEDLVRKRLALLGSIGGRKVGIFISSKLGQNRRDLALQLYSLAQRKGYVPSLFISDYLDPSYVLGLDLDFIVYTGCPRVPIDDQERYPIPIITPEEFLYKLGVLKDYRIGWITRVPREGTEA